MEKVKLPRDVAESLNKYKSELPIGWKKHVLQIATTVKFYSSFEPEFAIRHYADEVSLDDLIRALVFDWEIEETPEDKVKNYYHSLKRDEDWEPDEYQRACGVVMTLGLLGIKIEGIN